VADDSDWEADVLPFIEKADTRARLAERRLRVVFTAGASVDAGHESGVAIFTLAKGGLMYEAAVGEQRFKVKSRKRNVTHVRRFREVEGNAGMARLSR
jgi:hypothetical protein